MTRDWDSEWLYHVVTFRGILGNKQWYVSSSINGVSVRLVCIGDIQPQLMEVFV